MFEHPDVGIKCNMPYLAVFMSRIYTGRFAGEAELSNNVGNHRDPLTRTFSGFHMRSNFGTVVIHIHF